jgi:hypothetical protein
MAMEQKFTAIWQEDEWFVAQCVEVDIASQGHMEDEPSTIIVMRWSSISSRQ